MYTKESLSARLIELIGNKPLFLGNTVKYLLSFLSDEEEVLAYQTPVILEGKYGEFLLTNSHVYFIEQGIFKKRSEFSFAKINHVEKTTGVLWADLKLSGSGFNITFEKFLKNKIDEICNIIQSNISNPQKEEKNTADDTIAKIQKLNELKDKGILTEEEFNTKKQELVNRL